MTLSEIAICVLFTICAVEAGAILYLSSQNEQLQGYIERTKRESNG